MSGKEAEQRGGEEVRQGAREAARGVASGQSWLHSWALHQAVPSLGQTSSILGLLRGQRRMMDAL